MPEVRTNMKIGVDNIERVNDIATLFVTFIERQLYFN